MMDVLIWLAIATLGLGAPILFLWFVVRLRDLTKKP